MRSFSDVSIRTKLTVLLAGVVTLALLIASAVFAANDLNRIKRTLVEHHSVLADVLGANSTAALDFDAPTSAEIVLSSLQLEPAVTFACTYDARGKVFATYRKERSADYTPPQKPGDGIAFTDDGYLEIFRPITQDGRTLGTLYLRVSMAPINAQIRYNIGITVLVLFVALITAILLGWRLQLMISEPILRLVQATEAVARKADYSLRVPKQGNDELGALCDSFNAMLEQIRKRDAELEQHRLKLEHLVRERTQTLEDKSEELARSNDALAQANEALQIEIAQRELAAQQQRETAAELLLSNQELEQFNQLMIGREKRLVELKRQINELSQALGRPAPYDLSFAAPEPEGGMS